MTTADDTAKSASAVTITVVVFLFTEIIRTREALQDLTSRSPPGE